MAKKTKKEIQALVKTLEEWSDAYYNDKPLVSNSEYEESLELLREYDPANGYFSRVGAKPRGGVKVPHPFLMGSLDNVFNAPDVLKRFDKFEHGSLGISHKIDGCALRLLYERGRLVCAATRGDGWIGEDRTKQAREINDIPNDIPSDIIRDFTGEIIGEVYMRYDVFEELNEAGHDFANPRNAASGSMLLDDPEEVAKRKLNFFAHDARCDSMKFDTDVEKVRCFQDAFPWVPTHYGICRASGKRLKDLEAHIKDTADIREKLDYPIDGLVISIYESHQRKAAGMHRNRPWGQVAYKFPSERGSTTVTSLEWPVGRTGIVMPVANVEPIQLAGTTVRRSTLHSWNRAMKELRVYQGCTVVMEKGGDIIPQVISVTEDPNMTDAERGCRVAWPVECPVCSTELTFDDVNLWCENEECPARMLRHYEHWFKTLGVKDIGPGAISKLVNTGFVQCATDFYELDLDQLEMAGFGPGQAKIIRNAIQGTLSVPLSTFLAALGVRLLGRTRATLFAETYGTITVCLDMLARGCFELPKCKAKSIRVITDSYREQWAIFSGVRQYVTVEDYATPEGVLSGKSFCITGTLTHPKSEMRDFIEEHGGKWKTSVTKDLSYLITDDPKSTTGKSGKADKHGVEKITEDVFFEMLEEVNG